MSLHIDLGTYQEKALRSAAHIVELEGALASESDALERDRLRGHIDGHRAMLRVFDAMVLFLNCCIEFRRSQLETAIDLPPAKEA